MSEKNITNNLQKNKIPGSKNSDTKHTCDIYREHYRPFIFYVPYSYKNKQKSLYNATVTC